MKNYKKYTKINIKFYSISKNATQKSLNYIGRNPVLYMKGRFPKKPLERLTKGNHLELDNYLFFVVILEETWKCIKRGKGIGPASASK